MERQAPGGSNCLCFEAGNGSLPGPKKGCLRMGPLDGAPRGVHHRTLGSSEPRIGSTDEAHQALRPTGGRRFGSEVNPKESATNIGPPPDLHLDRSPKKRRSVSNTSDQKPTTNEIGETKHESKHRICKTPWGKKNTMHTLTL